MGGFGITNPAEEHFERGGWGWDGSEWKKLALLWGYTERYAEVLTGTIPAGGIATIAGTAVPAGEVWVMQFMSVRNETAVLTNGELWAVYSGVGTFVLTRVAGTAAWFPVTVQGPLVLSEGDYLAAWAQAAVGDSYRACFSGYKMAVS